ncbi:hypothetical protein ACUNV4_06485 [Granulosicoccus sp. 3-233]|uniref:hypothetical protein n=1 Tax=Granulosicoccus sp. 3-233 TaxID=3417969 RepID=UPI003D33BED5
MKNNKKILNRSVRKQLTGCVLSVLTLAGLAGSLSVQASQFGLRVLDQSGMAVSGASVCVGLPGNYKQFGSSFTDSEGLAIIDVPNVPLVVTVSKTRFSGLRMSEPARGFTMIKEVVLSEGVPGPRCRAGSTFADAPSSIKVDRVDVIETAGATQLQLDVSGRPSHYRVSDQSGFHDASWQPYDSRIVLPLSLARQGQIFLQMRRYEGSSDSWLEARSSVVEVLLPLSAH